MHATHRLYYCIQCDMLHDAAEAKVIFKTGYRHQHGVDYPLGFCKRREEAQVYSEPLPENTDCYR